MLNVFETCSCICFGVGTFRFDILNTIYIVLDYHFETSISGFCNQNFAGDDAETEPSGSSAKMTPKQLEAKLKKEAKAQSKKAEKEAKKEEAARKKEVQANTRKVIQMSTKLSAPVMTCCHKATAILSKLQDDGHGDNPKVKEFQKQIGVLEEFRAKCTAALTFYSKNAECELRPLPISTEKEVTTLIKDVNKSGAELKKDFKNVKPAA